MRNKKLSKYISFTSILIGITGIMVLVLSGCSSVDETSQNKASNLVIQQSGPSVWDNAVWDYSLWDKDN